MADNTVPIPQPPGLPLLGNINDINPEFPLGSMINMADKYGVCLIPYTQRPGCDLMLTCWTGNIPSQSSWKKCGRHFLASSG